MKKLVVVIASLLIVGLVAGEAYYLITKEREYWERPPVRDMTLEINYRGKLLHDWTTALESPDVAARRDAAAALKEVPPKDGDFAIGALSRAGGDEDALTRCRAASALGRVLTLAPIPAPVDALVRPIIPKVAEALKDPDPEVRREAAHALGSFGARRGMPIVALEELAANDKDPEVRKEAAASVKTLSGGEAKSKASSKAERGQPATKGAPPPGKP
jgi:hypothetical protein